jgi:hypothetical protein
MEAESTSSDVGHPKGMNSFQVLHALKSVLPDALVVTGRTGLPFLTLPQQHIKGDPVGPVKLFYNLAPKQFRIVDESNRKYEFRCGTAQEAVDEACSLYDKEPPEAPEILSDLG